jgi:hypothetical protein
MDVTFYNKVQVYTLEQAGRIQGLDRVMPVTAYDLQKGSWRRIPLKSPFDFGSFQELVQVIRPPPPRISFSMNFQIATIASGYSLEGDATKALEAGARGVIRKPVYMKQKLRQVREVSEEDYRAPNL